MLTVLSRVPDDHVGLRSGSKLVPRLDFDLVRHVGVRVEDHVFGPDRGHVIPAFGRVLPSPPNAVVEVGAVSFQIE